MLAAEETGWPDEAQAPLVVVIDVDDQVCALMRDVLEAAGYAVVARPFIASIVELASWAPAAVILDPGVRHHGDQLSGWELLVLMRAHRSLRSVPVIVCSADIFALAAHPELSEMAGVTVLTKPFDLEQLEAAVSASVSHG